MKTAHNAIPIISNVDSSSIGFTMCMCVLRVYDVSLWGHIDNRNIVSYDIGIISAFGYPCENCSSTSFFSII